MIRVLINYGGRNTNERRIEPGEYAEDDPRLFGIADYLVEHGHAVRIDDKPSISKQSPFEDAEVRWAKISAVTETLTTAPGGEVLVVDDPTLASALERLPVSEGATITSHEWELPEGAELEAGNGDTVTLPAEDDEPAVKPKGKRR